MEGKEKLHRMIISFVIWLTSEQARWTKSCTVIGYPSGQDGTILSAQYHPLCQARKYSRKPYNVLYVNPSLTMLVHWRWLDIGLILFCYFMDLNSATSHLNFLNIFQKIFTCLSTRQHPPASNMRWQFCILINLLFYHVKWKPWHNMLVLRVYMFINVPGLVCSNPPPLVRFGNDGPVWSAAELTQTKTKISQWLKSIINIKVCKSMVSVAWRD